MDQIRSQALYFKNIPIIAPKYRSVIHLEDKEDRSFWDEQLQKHRPGKYFYVLYSKSKNGLKTTGCDQCLKYRPYLDSRFFICIDSDLRYLMNEPNLDAAHYVIQTYTYSFENHYCEANNLQASVSANANGCCFDFLVFLQNLSDALYEPLLLLLYCKRTGSKYLNEFDFRHIMKSQCSGTEMKNNGQGYVDYIRSQFAPYLSGAAAIGFNVELESANYNAMNLRPDNAYLHVRGHNLFDLVSDIGRMCCSKLRISFRTDVLLKVQVGGGYWEYDELVRDLSSI